MMKIKMNYKDKQYDSNAAKLCKAIEDYVYSQEGLTIDYNQYSFTIDLDLNVYAVDPQRQQQLTDAFNALVGEQQ